MKSEHRLVVATGLLLFIFNPVVSTASPTSSPCRPMTTTVVANPIIRGVVPAKYHRSLQPATDPAMKALLKRFDTPPVDFSYKKRLQREEKAFSMWTVTFPSPFCSADECNNVVWGEYFQTKAKGPHPAVIVLHPLDTRPEFMRFICEKLATEGMDSIWIRMAYYGERASQGVFSQFMLLQKPDNLISAVCQTVMDIRRTSEFLSAQPDVDGKRIYLCGGSLGALVGSLAMGVDGNYPKAALVLGGGNLARIFTENEAFIRMLRTVGENKNITKEDIAREFKPIDPLTYVNRTGVTDVLMINAKKDTVIPPASSTELASHLKHVNQIWYDCGHEINDWDAVMKDVLAFFKQ